MSSEFWGKIISYLREQIRFQLNKKMVLKINLGVAQSGQLEITWRSRL